MIIKLSVKIAIQILCKKHCV